MGRGRWRCHASSLGSAAAAIRGAVREAGARAAARMKRRVFVVGVGMTKVRRCPPAIGPSTGTAGPGSAAAPPGACLRGARSRCPWRPSKPSSCFRGFPKTQLGGWSWTAGAC